MSIFFIINQSSKGCRSSRLLNFCSRWSSGGGSHWLYLRLFGDQPHLYFPNTKWGFVSTANCYRPSMIGGASELAELRRLEQF